MRQFVALLILLDLRNIAAFEDDDYSPDRPDSIQYQVMQSASLQEGKAEYDRLVSYSKMPQYGQCWTRAVHNLQVGCNQLTDEIQMRLAVEFANCFLEKSGSKIYECDSTVPIKECINVAKTNEPSFFAAYLQFFTHTQTICFYLSSEMFQKKAEKQVNNLLKASDFVTANLEESKNVQEKIVNLQNSALESSKKASHLQEGMYEMQRKSLETSEKALVSQKEVLEIAERSQQALQRNLLEMQRSVGETRQWILDVGDRISRLQSAFIDEFTGFYSWIFYFVNTLGIFFLTSPARLAGARIWLFMLIGITFFVERFIAQNRLAIWEESADGMPDAALIKEMIQEDTNMIRRIFWGLSALILMYFGVTFKDLNEQNAKRIAAIMEELQSLRQALPNGAKAGEFTVAIKSTVDQLDAVHSAIRTRRSLSRAPIDSVNTPARDGSAMSSAARRSVTPSRSFCNLNESSRNLTPVREVNEENGENDESFCPDQNGSPSKYRHNYHLRSASREPLAATEGLVKRFIRQMSVEREKTPEQTARDVIERLAEVPARIREAINKAQNNKENLD